MKTARISSALLAFSFFIVSCTQHELVRPHNTESLESDNSTPKVNTSSEHAFFQSVLYAAQFDYYTDENVYDPFLYAESGILDFSFEAKIIGRINHFYDSLGLATDRAILKKSFQFAEMTETELLGLGADEKELFYAMEMRGLFENRSLSIDQLRYSMDEWLIDIRADDSLNKDAKERLELGYDIAAGILSRALSNGAINVSDIADYYPEPEMIPCGAAVAFYAVAFVGLCAATGGIGVACAVVGFGGSVWGVFESC